MEEQEEFEKRIAKLREQEERVAQRNAVAGLPKIIHTWILPGSQGQHLVKDASGKPFRFDYAQDDVNTFGPIVYTGVQIVPQSFIPVPLPSKYTTFGDHSLSTVVEASLDRAPLPLPKDPQRWLSQLIVDKPGRVTFSTSSDSSQDAQRLADNAAQKLSESLATAKEQLEKKQADFSKLLAEYRSIKEENAKKQETSNQISALREEIRCLSDKIQKDTFTQPIPSIAPIVATPASNNSIKEFIDDFDSLFGFINCFYRTWHVTYSESSQPVLSTYAFNTFRTLSKNMNINLMRLYIRKCKERDIEPDVSVYSLTIGSEMLIVRQDEVPAVCRVEANWRMKQLKSRWRAFNSNDIIAVKNQLAAYRDDGGASLAGWLWKEIKTP